VWVIERVSTCKIEETSYVGFDDVVNTLLLNGLPQRIDTVVRAPSWAIAIATVFEHRLENGFQHTSGGQFHDLVLEAADTQRSKGIGGAAALVALAILSIGKAAKKALDKMLAAASGFDELVKRARALNVEVSKLEAVSLLAEFSGADAGKAGQAIERLAGWRSDWLMTVAERVHR
jgi:hypothetical protein